MSAFEKLRRRKVKGDFEKVVSPEIVSAVASSLAGGWTPTNERKHFQFIVLQVDEAKPDDVPVLIGKVVDTFLDQGAIVADISSSLIVGYFGFPFPTSDAPESRQRLVDALLAQNGKAVRVAHGQCEGLVGNFGSKRRSSYGAVIPNFSGILKKLLASPFGAAIEVLH